MRCSLFWDVTQRRLVVSYRCFGKNCRSHLQGSLLKMAPKSCPSVTNYRSALRNISEGRRSHIHRGGSLNSYERKPVAYSLLFQQKKVNLSKYKPRGHVGVMGV